MGRASASIQLGGKHWLRSVCISWQAVLSPSRHAISAHLRAVLLLPVLLDRAGGANGGVEAAALAVLHAARSGQVNRAGTPASLVTKSAAALPQLHPFHVAAMLCPCCSEAPRLAFPPSRLALRSALHIGAHALLPNNLLLLLLLRDLHSLHSQLACSRPTTRVPPDEMRAPLPRTTLHTCGRATAGGHRQRSVEESLRGHAAAATAACQT